MIWPARWVMVTGYDQQETLMPCAALLKSEWAWALEGRSLSTSVVMASTFATNSIT